MRTVEVEKSPVALKRTVSSATNLTGEDTIYSAHTNWFFHCTPTFDYELNGTRCIDSDAYEVDLTIKKVQMKISLDIEICSSAKDQSIVSPHENGHAAICKDIYDSAEKIAAQCAGSAVGHKYTGAASDAKAAQEAALNQAAEQICRHYRLATSEKANRISALYDKFSESKNPLSVDECVRQAEAVDKKSSLLHNAN